MRIIKKDNGEMLIKEGIIGSILIGVFFVLVGLFLLKPEIMSMQIDTPLYIAFVFIFLGVLAMVLPARNFVTFNKNNKTLTIAHSNLWLKTNETYDLEEVIKIKLLTIWRPVPTKRYYRLVCVLRDGKEVFLNPTTSSYAAARISFSGGVHIPVKVIGEEVAAFLSLPFEEETRSRHDTEFYKQHRPGNE